MKSSHRRFLNKVFGSLLIFILMQASAANTVDQALGEYAWEKRQIIVFAPALDHPDYLQFLKKLDEFQEDFTERKLHVWHVVEGQAVKLENIPLQSPIANGFRKKYGVNTNEFKLILVGYDQQEKLRQNRLQMDDLFAEIDQMPMRLQEMQDSAQ
jgi:hypothetical protein